MFAWAGDGGGVIALKWLNSILLTPGALSTSGSGSRIDQGQTAPQRATEVLAVGESWRAGRMRSHLTAGAVVFIGLAASSVQREY